MQLRKKGEEKGGGGKHPAVLEGLNLQPQGYSGLGASMSHIRGISKAGGAGQRVPQKGSDARLQWSCAQGDALDPAQPGGDGKSFRKH